MCIRDSCSSVWMVSLMGTFSQFNISYKAVTIVAKNSNKQRTWVVIVLADGKNVFVPNVLLTFKSGSKKGDYHCHMKCEN